MNITERIPLIRIQFIDEMTLTAAKPFLKRCEDPAEIRNSFDTLKNFCKTHKKTAGECKQVYHYAGNTAFKGRLYACPSLQSILREFRGFFCNGFMTDIDMVNCHPKILNWICKKNKIQCPQLEYYCNNRELVLSELKDRDAAKINILKCINDQKYSQYGNTKFFKKFDAEMKELQKVITSLSQYAEIVAAVPPEKQRNRLGSAISRILCYHENEILQHALNYVTTKNIEVSCVAFDGFMIYGDYYNNTELISEIQQYVDEQFEGLHMEWAYKPHCTDIVMPPDFVPKPDHIDEENDYDKMKIEFEKKHCKIIENASYVMICEDNTTKVVKETHIVAAYKHLQCLEMAENKISPKSFIMKWISDPKIKKYDGIDVYPPDTVCPDNIYNAWTPYDMERVTEWTHDDTAIETLNSLLRPLCGNDESQLKYITLWIAHMIRRPSQKSIMPIFLSEEGAGKGTLLQLISKMFGNAKVLDTTKPSRDVYGEFNGIMANSFLVCLNELSKSETSGADGFMKGLITDPYLTINEKGQIPYKIRSFHRFIGMSNGTDPMKTTEGERRKIFIKSSSELKGNAKYFNHFYSKLNSIDFVKTCYEYFKGLDEADNFNSLPLPITEYHRELMDTYECPVDTWFKAYVLQHRNEKEKKFVYTVALFDSFNDYKDRFKINFECNIVKFGLQLTNIKLNGLKKHRRNNGNGWSIDIQKLLPQINSGLAINVDELDASKPVGDDDVTV